jgi:hypothetical protein
MTEQRDSGFGFKNPLRSVINRIRRKSNEAQSTGVAGLPDFEKHSAPSRTAQPSIQERLDQIDPGRFKVLSDTDMGNIRHDPGLRPDELTPQQQEYQRRDPGITQRDIVQEEPELDTFVEASGKAIRNVPERFQQSAAGLVQSMFEPMSEFRQEHEQRTAERMGITLNDYRLLYHAGRNALIPEEILQEDMSPKQLADYVKLNLVGSLNESQLAAVRDAGIINPEEMVGFSKYWREEVGKTMEDINVEHGSPAYYGSAIVGSLAEMGPALLGSMITKNPSTAMQIMSGQVGGAQYAEAREKGASIDDAQTYAVASAMAEVIPEYVPLSIILKPGQNVFSKILKGGAAEGMQEMLTETINIGLDRGILNEDMTWEEARTRLMDAGIIGTGAGAGMGATASGIESGAQAVKKVIDTPERQVKREIDAVLDADFRMSPEQIAMQSMSPEYAGMQMKSELPTPTGPVSAAVNKGLEAQIDTAVEDIKQSGEMPGNIQVKPESRYTVTTPYGQINGVVESIEPDGTVFFLGDDGQQYDFEPSDDIQFGPETKDAQLPDEPGIPDDSTISTEGMPKTEVVEPSPDKADEGLSEPGRSDVAGEPGPDSGSGISGASDTGKPDDTLIYKSDGKPFSSANVAERAIKNRRLKNHEVVPVKDGFAIRPLEEVTVSELSESDKQDDLTDENVSQMPKKVIDGINSFKPKPIKGTLYRETNMEGLTSLLRETLSNNQIEGSVNPVFVSDNKDLALGQGKNKGVSIRFNGDLVSGEKHFKPGTVIEGMTGSEYKTDYINKDAIESFTIPKDFKLKGVARIFANEQFDYVENPDGTTTYTRKDLSVPVQVITDEPVTAEVDQQEADQAVPVDQINSEIDEIMDKVKQRRIDDESKFDYLPPESIKQDIDYLSEEEKSRLHELKMMLPTQGRQAIEAKERNRQRALDRKKKKIEKESAVVPEEESLDTNEQPSIKAKVSEKKTVSTPTGRDVEVEYAVVSANDLVASNLPDGRVNPDYPQILQPRDRTRASSVAQINSMAGDLKPRLLDKSELTSDGSPVVSEAGVVESGNGRTLAISKAYRDGTAKEYEAYVRENYDSEGIENPVVVRIRKTDMTDQDMVDYVRESNQRTTMQMSATEQAMADAEKVSAIIGDYSGGDVDMSANRPFVRKFVQQIASDSERSGMMDKDGVLSQDGKRRIEASLIAAAYGDESLITDVFESSSSDIKAIGGALLDAAPNWLMMRQAEKNGSIAEGMDLTDNLIDAVNLIKKARVEGKPLAELLNTADLLSGTVDPDTEAFVRIFYRGDNLNKARGRDKVANSLKYYTELALETQPGEGLFGDQVRAQQIAEQVNEKLRQQESEKETGDLFSAGKSTPGSDVAAGGTKGQGQKPNKARKQEAEKKRELDSDKYQDYEVRKNEIKSKKEKDNLKEAQEETTFILRGIEGTVLGDGMAADFIDRSGADLIGRKLSGTRDLSSLAQVYRNPSFETIRYYFVKNEKVVFHTGVTSRLPGSSVIFPGINSNESIEWLKDLMVKTDADGYFMSHNHPSGNPEPSRADINTTRNLSKEVPGFKGHVIINHETYSWIDKNGEYDTHLLYDDALEDESRRYGKTIKKESTYLGHTINSPRDIGLLLERMSNVKNMLMIGTKGESVSVTFISEINPESIKNKDNKTLTAVFNKLIKDSGSQDVFVANYDYKDKEIKAILTESIRSGYIVDALSNDGESLVSILGFARKDYKGGRDKTKGYEVQTVTKKQKELHDQDVQNQEEIKPKKVMFSIKDRAIKRAQERGYKGSDFSEAVNWNSAYRENKKTKKTTKTEELTSFGLTDHQKDKILSDWRLKRGIKIPKNAKIWRGVSDTSGEGFATYGQGLYTTTNKSDAKGYAGSDGQVIEMSLSDLPKNALRFDTVQDYQNWLGNQLQKELGLKGNRDTGDKIGNVDKAIRLIDPDIDGIQIGKGKDALFVLWPEVGNKMSVSNTSKPSTKENILSAIDQSPLGDFAKKLIDSNRLVVAGGISEMPVAVSEASGMTSPDGTIYLNSANLDASEAIPVMLHEAFHAGSKSMKGTKQWDNLMNDLQKIMNTQMKGQGKANEFWEKAAERVNTAIDTVPGMNQSDILEEFAAYAIEEYESAPTTVKKWVDRFIGAIKAWLNRRFGRQFGKVTPAQLRAMAVQSLRDSKYIGKNDAENDVFYTIAYHGTPHRFDTFSLDAIGTGEGTQAYGWGLYFSSNKEVAKWYNKTLSNIGQDVEITDRPGRGNGWVEIKDPVNPDIILSTSIEDGYMGAYLEAMDNPNKIGGRGTATKLYINALKVAQSNNVGWKSDSVLSDASFRMYERLISLGIPFKQNKTGNKFTVEPKALESINFDEIISNSGLYQNASDIDGGIYQVDIPESDVLLDWDKSLSDQGGITSSVREVTDSLHGEGTFDSWVEANDGEVDFRDWKDNLMETMTDKDISMALNSMGIPGLKYLDGDSKNADRDSHNYVIWDENMVTVQAVNDELVQASIKGDVNLSLTQNEEIASDLVKMYESGYREDTNQQYGQSDSKELSEILSDINMRDDLTVSEVQMEVPMGGGKMGDKAKTYIVKRGDKTSMYIFDVDGDRPFIEIGDAEGARGVGGMGLYLSAMTWAANNGKKLRPDPRGISHINRMRRSEAMIASMMKSGTSAHLEPHHDQFVGLLPEAMFKSADDRHGYIDKDSDIAKKLMEIKKTYWMDENKAKSASGRLEIRNANINNMVIANTLLGLRRANELADYKVNGDGKYFKQVQAGDKAGSDQGSKMEPIDAEQFESIQDGIIESHAEDGIGLSTMRRAIAASSVVPGTSQKELQETPDVAVQRFSESLQPFEEGSVRPGAARSMVPDSILNRVGQSGSADQIFYSLKRGGQDGSGSQLFQESNIDPSLGRGRFFQFTDKLIHNAQDKFYALKQVQKKATIASQSQDAYLAEELYHGRARKRLDVFEDTYVQPILKLIQDSGLTMNEVESWLHARHAQEANAHLKSINQDMENNEALSGMSDEVAQSILEEHADNESLQEIGRMVDEINDSRLNIMGYEELMPLEDIASIRDSYDHYVPLHREEVNERMGPRGQGFNIKGKEVKRRVGSHKKVENILPHLISQYQTTLIRAEKARVHRALYKLAAQNPDSEFWTLDKPPMMKTVGEDGQVQETVDPTFKNRDNVLTVKINGREHTIEFNEKNDYAMRIASSMKNLDAQNMGFVIQMMADVNRLLSAVNTGWNPEFVISNAIRDIQTALYNISDTDASKIGAAMLRDYPKSIAGIRNAIRGDKSSDWAKEFEEFEREGGRTGWMEHMDSIDDFRKRLMSDFNTMGTGKVAITKRQIRKLANLIKDYNDVVENAVRLSAYVNAKRAGLSKAKAASLAKNLTVNFNRKGAAGPTLNALYLFYNASIQGSARLLQAMAKSKKTRALVAGTVVASMIIDVINRATSDEDDDGIPYYDKIPDYVKERNLIIMGEGETYYSLPLPWGYNVFHVMGQEAGEAFSHPEHKPLDSAARIATTAIGAFNPIGSDGSLAQTLSPTVTDPIVQIASNKTWSGADLMPENKGFGPDKPQSQMYWQSARSLSRDVAEKVNELTGGNRAKPGMIDVSPEVIDLWIDFLTGGAGRFVANAIDTAKLTVSDDPIEQKNIPFLRKIRGKVTPRYDQERFFDNMSEMNQLSAQIDEYKNEGAMLDIIESDNEKLLPLIHEAKSIQKQLAKMRKVRRQAADAGDEEAVEEIQKEMESIYKDFNKRYLEAVKSE